MTNEIEHKRRKTVLFSTTDIVDSCCVWCITHAANDQIHSHSYSSPPADLFLNQMGGPFRFTCFCLRCTPCHKCINISWFIFSFSDTTHNNCNKIKLFGNKNRRKKNQYMMTFGFWCDVFGFHQSWWRSMTKSTELSAHWSIPILGTVNKIKIK